ncbi:putative D-alanyl-glycyl endopeptidase-like protein cysteine peptidase Clan CA family C51 [Leptomonas seymouri]|uniref:Putative D-alanyl-glycyl endopeptidase-like protein cysteine peptidase Clan CA family C51 n=1 Tax=Leptomonas seymouri TaxID=5684 RepID=A0A0N1I7J8_LEPSE|nr:putative D-alanyl-glycyl endopeptidase-like protein cysteine peptidase Clan CA family C51 [Leptomonas seymouri]|eukprot:KPI87330.1 putative D-alanyl-glycyl endopeptidase-like protein cysteine peptidase Clan CA family C51 [Leptomonas seymouri]
MMSGIGNHIGSCGNPDPGGAPARLSGRIGSDIISSESTILMSSQRINGISTTTVDYGGSQAHEMLSAAPQESDAGERGGRDIAESPQAGSSSASERINIFTSGEGEGGCIVANGNAVSNTRTFCSKVRHFLLNSDPLLYASLRWGLAALLILFLAFIVFGIVYSGVFSNTNCTVMMIPAMEEDPPRWCHTPFGTILGVFENTFAYSNCNDDYQSIIENYIKLPVSVVDASTGVLTMVVKEFYAGLEWQCVEFARRYWMLNGRPKPAYFGLVDKAADIWNLEEVHLLENTSQTLPLHRYKSGDRVVQDGLQPPQSGDIVIYPVQSGGFPVGHVAVIAKVEMAEHGFIYVAEQNWGSTQWSEPYHNYSRKIPLHYNPITTAITLKDPEGVIMGWMRYG